MNEQGELKRPSQYSEAVIGAFYEEARERIGELERMLAERDAEIARLKSVEEWDKRLKAWGAAMDTVQRAIDEADT